MAIFAKIVFIVPRPCGHYNYFIIKTLNNMLQFLDFLAKTPQIDKVHDLTTLRFLNTFRWLLEISIKSVAPASLDSFLSGKSLRIRSGSQA